MLINGILLLYYHYLWSDAPTIMEHVRSFENYSSFKVHSLNTELGFPAKLQELQFEIIVLHYSLFGYTPYLLDANYLKYLSNCSSSYKIAFFQDEHRYCKQRFEFINRYNLDCIYTLLEPANFSKVYGRYTKVPKLVTNLPGYVSDDLIALSQRFGKGDRERTVDIGYRGRALEYYMGRGGQEKSEIGENFLARARGLGLTLDIATAEKDRIYGSAWYKFLGNCRAVLGVEAGVSIFDLEDEVRLEYEKLRGKYPNMGFHEMSAQFLDKYEDNFYYRTISPRHFEAAAMWDCQILFEGKYSGIMQPLVHYIPLKKDFSNFADVISLFRDDKRRHQITAKAYEDLIDSGLYSYRNFVAGFDQELRVEGFHPGAGGIDSREISYRLNRDLGRRRFRAIIRNVPYYPFPGRRGVKQLAKFLLRRRSD